MSMTNAMIELSDLTLGYDRHPAVHHLKVAFDEGDLVQKNDVVVRLDDRDLQAALDAAKAQVVAAPAKSECSSAKSCDGTKAQVVAAPAKSAAIQKCFVIVLPA